MRLVFFLFFLPGVLHANDVIRSASPSTCEALLKLSAGYQRRIAGLVQRGPASDREAIAFVAMSPLELRALAINGVTKSGAEFRVHLNLDNPIVARFARERPELRVMAQRQTPRELAVETEAWCRSVAEAVVTRAAHAGLMPVKAAPFLERFFAELRPMHRDLRAHAFTPDFDRIYRAIADVGEVPFDEPTTVETELSGRMQELLNAGPDYAGLIGRQRLRTLAQAFGIAWDDIDAADSAARAGLVDLLRDLPGRAGFTVALNGRAFNRLRFSTNEPPKTYSIDVAFVAGVAAYGAGDQNFLGELSARFPPR